MASSWCNVPLANSVSKHGHGTPRRLQFHYKIAARQLHRAPLSVKKAVARHSTAGQPGERPVPSKGRKNIDTEDDESHGGQKSIWLTYSEFNPFSVVLRGPRSSSVLKSFFGLSVRSDGWTFTRLP